MRSTLIVNLQIRFLYIPYLKIPRLYVSNWYVISKTKFEFEGRSVYTFTVNLNLASHTGAIILTECNKKHVAEENI